MRERRKAHILRKREGVGKKEKLRVLVWDFFFLSVKSEIAL